jgi:fatty acid amide hydrolase
VSELFRLSASAISGLLQRKEVSSEEVTRSHFERIDAIDSSGIRAFTELLRDSALVSARRSDQARRRGEAVGPLHGVPCTIKESVDHAGSASTLGAEARREHRALDDAGVVQELRDVGAVILGRTNVSQLLLFHESRNAVFGQTANPWSAVHTPGGSSGGEAAAIAAGMSPLGIGTDIGGSIRVPAHFSGIAGLKPSLDRWTNLGSNSALAGQEVIRSQIGPMARTSRDVALLMRAFDPRRMSRLDPRVPPLPFGRVEDVDIASLRVGILVDDGLVPPSAALERAVRRAANAFKDRGATIVPFTPPNAEAAIYSYIAALSSDGGESAKRILRGETMDPALRSLRVAASMPTAARKVAARVARLAGEMRLARMLEAAGEKRVADLWALTNEIRAYRIEVLRTMEASKVDLIVCPPHATPALPHGFSSDFALAGSGSMLWNLVQFPAGVVPVTSVRADETRREIVRDRFERRAAEVDRASAGLPVGVQIVGRPWADEVVLAGMIAVEDSVRSDDLYPVTPTP